MYGDGTGEKRGGGGGGNPQPGVSAPEIGMKCPGGSGATLDFAPLERAAGCGGTRGPLTTGAANGFGAVSGGGKAAGAG